MPKLTTEAALNKITKITFGMGLLMIGFIFIGLPVPASPVLGVFLAIIGLIQVSRGFISLRKEDLNGRIIHFFAGIALLILAFFMFIEYIILLAYLLGFDMLYSITSYFSSASGGAIPILFSAQTGISLGYLLTLLIAVITLILISSLYMLGRDAELKELSKHALYLLSLFGFMLVLFFSLNAIASLDGYLRPLLFYILNLSSENQVFLALGISLMILSIYSLTLVYNDLAKIVQREFKRKYSLPY